MIATRRQDRLSAWLARLREYGWVAPANIDTSSVLSTIEPPLMLNEMPREVSKAQIQRALFELGITLNLSQGNATQNEIMQRLALLSLDEMQNIHDQLQERFAKRVSSITEMVLAFLIPIYIWQSLMIEEINTHIASQVILGSRGKHGKHKNEMDSRASFQLWFLQRFGDYLAFSAATSVPLSESKTVSRAISYGGTGRAAYYYTLERNLQDILTDGAEGYIVQYVAMDDPRTCNPCHDAQGYYLPTDGPYPGEVCLGQAYCRCKRVLIFDPYTYRMLLDKKRSAN